MVADASFHGTRDGGAPEWPPSPLRLFQALVDAAASRWREPRFAEHAKPMFEWFQQLSPAIILAPNHRFGVPFRIAVPNNDWDSPARVWSKGGEPVKPHRPIDLKTMKTVHPTRLICADENDGSALHYLYPLPNGHCPHVDILTLAARSITHLGWGIDMVVGDAGVITHEQAVQLPGHRWQPSLIGGVPLRTPKAGTLDDLARKHADFLGRLANDGFRPVPPLRVFNVVRYRRHDQPLDRPCRIFELRNTDGSRFSYPHAKLIHIAGMVRHMAIEAMKKNPPCGGDDDWVETYVAGHRKPGNAQLSKLSKCRDDEDESQQREAFTGSDVHRQLSYLPLPSIGHEHTNPSVRRVMIAAPIGDDAWLDHVARRLAGQVLKPMRGDEFASREPPILVPVRSDNVARFYTQRSHTWYSVTPVILPGYDDCKPEKTQKLIERALRHSGIEQPCTFEWNAFSRFSKVLSAHNHKHRSRYLRPTYLRDLTAVHLTLRFHDGSKDQKPLDVPGPLAIGAGRHCGLGVFAIELPA
ncbi:MAG: type I-U CRISPR-associated protein Csb2 [Phycisphaerales bacterium]|nr:type I-U CRISPR-associated protein Csb2 [Phycisphaerales bacterium]